MAAAKQRVVRISTEQPTYEVCVVGTEISLDINGSIPKGATHFAVNGTAGLRVSVICDPMLVTDSTDALKWPLNSGVEVIVSMNGPSSTINDNKVRVSYYGPSEGTLASAWLYLTCVGRTPNSQMFDYARVQSYADLEDMSLMILTTEGPAGSFEKHKLHLCVSMFDAPKLRVFHDGGDGSLSAYKHVLGSEKLSYRVKCSGGRQRTSFLVEGLAFPDAGFEGLVSLSATLLEASSQNCLDPPIFSDTVVFRVAPWIMTPNTLKPLEVFVCSTEEKSASNKDFVKAVRSLAKEANCKLTVCPYAEHKGDLWIQDEMELGYVEAPHKSFPVVFDSPRNRGLKDFPFKKVLGPDFGYVTREPKNPEHVSGLDSFGNLDVSPPVTVKGKEYPLGRILIGSSFPAASNERMSKVVRDFLYAQKVQPPVELYSDWLFVGHVDEFLSFVPAPDRKGFRLLLASPLACYKLLKEKQREGYGGAAFFEGLQDQKRQTIDEILTNKTVHSTNKHAQSCIDWNRSILKQKLGLSERDILDIPQLFTSYDSWAMAFFPNMVNMLVLGKHLGIPKPFGPVIGGQCCLEAEVHSLLQPLGLTCRFIDDFASYHSYKGEIHCGTNVRREPFSFHWWNMIP
ncbi:protein-arginine deiminase type-3-like [Sphaerodactylus townsendi]|uniref:protein-arginine deiminase type-3-like n=1 Tax=Sphaerodactylus townsendi TaxID=933632 RepID=UPI0020260239|nr:protein-arginine deiminase type-3-like [Sphaerodactylus townsendi]